MDSHEGKRRRSSVSSEQEADKRVLAGLGEQGRVFEPEEVVSRVVAGSTNGVGSSDNVDADGLQVRSELSVDGRLEYPDPVPVSAPLGHRPSPTLRDTIERIMMNHQLQVLADIEGFDSPEDADDFDIEDDPLDPATPYERHFYPAPEGPAKPASDAGLKADGSQTSSAPVTEGGVEKTVQVPPAPPSSSFTAEQVELFKAFAAWQSQNSVKSE